MIKKYAFFFIFLFQLTSAALPQSDSAATTRSTQTDKQKVTIVSPTDPVDTDIRLVEGRVIAVYDGDTLSLQTRNEKIYSIRVHGIDAPEGRQSFGKESREALIKMVLDKDVIVIINKKDLFDRYLGSVFYEGRDVGLWQLKGGMAWHFKRFAGEQTAENRDNYEKAERQAKAAKVGLWSDKNPQPPWDFRGDIIGVSGGSGNTPATQAAPKKDKSKKKNGRQYIRGPRGGCYYINSSGNKTYVKDKSLCDEN